MAPELIHPRAMQVSGYSEAIVAATASLLDGAWAADRGGVRDVYADFNGLTFNIVLVSLFGSDVAAGPEVCIYSSCLCVTFFQATHRCVEAPLRRSRTLQDRVQCKIKQQ